MHGIPKVVISDKDIKFTSAIWRDIFTGIGTHIMFIIVYHPQTDGQTERMNRTLEEMLRAFVEPSIENWDLHLPCCEFAMNNSFNESIRTTPFYLNYGRHPRSPTDFAFSESTAPAENFATAMDTALKRAQQCTRAAQDRQARYANKRRRALEFEAGEYVLLDSSILRLRHGSKKLAHTRS